MPTDLGYYQSDAGNLITPGFVIAVVIVIAVIYICEWQGRRHDR